MTKRTREDFLTPDLLVEQLADESIIQNKTVDNSLLNLGDRKIVKVKRHNQQTGQVICEEGPKLGVFKLAGALSKPPLEKEN